MVSIVAMSLAVNATGGAHVSTTVLLTPEQIDEAARKSVSFRPTKRSSRRTKIARG